MDGSESCIVHWFSQYLGEVSPGGSFDGVAVVLAPGAFRTDGAKTAHGLVRGTERFQVVGVVDADAAGHDAGEVLDGKRRGIPVFASLDDAIHGAPRRPDTVIVGVATPGGTLPPSLRAVLLEAASAGLSIVNGLHEFVAEDPQIAAAAARTGARIVDVRRPRPRGELHFWTGAIAEVRAPRVAVLGTDCALGKRTTARMLVEACNAEGVKAEMIYTGQTGWMQGARYGFVLDSVVNDFVSGELEHAIVTCDRQESPDVIVIEGQSSLRNPSGPCGAEMLSSGQARGVILQHAPGRACFRGRESWPIPSVAEEIQLIGLYGAEVLAVTLNGERLSASALRAAQQALAVELNLPVVRPLEEGVGALVPVVRSYLQRERG
jgi:uncharacterized NAD-dependent epimerase/dehydratase family protein